MQQWIIALVLINRNNFQTSAFTFTPFQKPKPLLSLTSEQIGALAPDDASRKAGQGLAKASKWVTVGSSSRAVWGECQGSGSKPYQTIVDSEDLAFKCSCPSRKFPCKHGLGLLLYAESDPSRFGETAAPEWVVAWLDKRSEKALKADAPASEKKPVDAAAQVKRSAAREEKAGAGLEALLLWMKDVIRGGLLQLPQKEERYFEALAKRMVDAQLPGIANTLRQIGYTNLFAEGWESEVMDVFAQLYIALSGYQNVTDTSDPLVTDFRRYLGFPQGAELVEEQPALPDTWMVIGSEQQEEGSLLVEKHWLQSTEGRTGLFLQFIPYGGRSEINLFAGSQFTGDVRYYPGSLPLRVAIRSLNQCKEPEPVPALRDWEEVANRESQTLAQAPLTTLLPAVVADLRPVLSAGKEWLIQDAAGKQMRLSKDFKDFWKWVALSGGSGLTTAVLGSEHRYLPLGVWHHNRYIPFN